MERLTNNLIRFGAALAFVATALIFAAGLIKTMLGAVKLLPGIPFVPLSGLGHTDQVIGTTGLPQILEGLEYIFLAPIVFLSFVSACVFSKDRIRKIAAAAAMSEPTTGAGPDSLLKILSEIKALVAGLMVAVLLTNLIARVVEGYEFTPIGLIAHLAATCLGVAYYLAASKHR